MVRLGRIEDAEMVDALFNEAKEVFKDLGTFQWEGLYPSKETFINDVINRTVFVYEENGEVVGAVTIMYNPDPNYKEIEGKWLNDEPYASIHRIVVSKKCQGKGIGDLLYKTCEHEIRKNSIHNVRVDTYYLNKSMLRIIEKNSFTRCGIIYLLRDNVFDRKREAFQKII